MLSEMQHMLEVLISCSSCCARRHTHQEHALQESQQLVQQQAAAVRANDKLANAVAARERAADEVARDIEMAKVEAERLLAEQVSWDLEVRPADPLLVAQTPAEDRHGAGTAEKAALLRHVPQFGAQACKCATA